ncbi:MAG: branched-chain amino acid ABC transporter permease [Lachnospiraceae bacterium]|nr:branched-chain amino acid ABC transporter permease [Lachnospiraceae bacterium]
MKKSTRSNIITYAMVIVAYIVMQTLVSTGSVTNLIQGLLVPLCAYSILAVSLNLTVGILGELSLGHAGFMCVGAFVSAAFSKINATSIENDLLRFIIAIIIAAVCAGIVGILIGIPVLRLKGDYLAIVTLAFGEIIKNVMNVIYLGVDSKGIHFCITKASDLNMESDGKIIINGATGITGTPHSSNFTIGVILLLITLFIVLNLINSRSGRAIMAIRDNSIAAESIGIDLTKYKMLAFSISAMLAGVAGALYSHNLSTLAATSKNFGYNMSIMILVFVVLGGIGNIRGSIIAAIILTLLPELLRAVNDYRMLIYAILLIALMLFNSSPAGINFREKYGIGRLLHKNGPDLSETAGTQRAHHVEGAGKKGV